jgi:peptidyl-prolyl cis-trans isomerase-like 4
LELIFSRFGLIMSCQVIRDKRTGDSLQYAFIEYDKREDAEQVKSSKYIEKSSSKLSSRHTSKCKMY